MHPEDKEQSVSTVCPFWYSGIVWKQPRQRSARGARAAERRAFRRVQRHLVVVHEVDRLNDVDLAVGRPRGAGRPERGPDGAAVGQVDEVDKDERADVVGVL